MADRKTAIVTGGSRGIGREVALRLADLGYDIAIVYIGDENEAKETVADCEKKGVKAKSYICNVASFEDTKATVAEIRKDFENIFALVNNAGITRDGLIAFMKEEDWDNVLSVNLKGAFNMIRHTAGLFIRNKGGRIVNISSVSGRTIMPIFLLNTTPALFTNTSMRPNCSRTCSAMCLAASKSETSAQ